MSKKFLSIGCINNVDKCNYIRPERLVAFDGINPETNRQYTRTEINNNKNTYKRICNVKSGRLDVCCNTLNEYPNSGRIIKTLRKRYPKMKLNIKNGELESILLSKTNRSGGGWVQLSPYAICKISKAEIIPTRFNDIDLAKNLVRDCFTDSCNSGEPELTLKKILGSEKEPVSYRYLDDMKVEESIKDYNIDYVKQYIRKYNSVNNPLTHNNYNNRLIHIVSIYNNKEDNINLLLALNAVINIKNIDGNTPLHLAAKYDNEIIMDKLLRVGIIPNTINNDGYNAAAYCVINGNKKTLNILYNNGINFQQLDNNGNNLIHISLMFGKNKYEIINTLVNFGVNVNDKNNDNISCIELLDYIIEYFEEKNKNKDTENNKKLQNEKLNTIIKDTFQVTKLNINKISDLFIELKSLKTFIDSRAFKQNYGNSAVIRSKEILGSPIEYDRKGCSGLNVNGDEDPKTCVEKGGQVVEYDLNTIIGVEYSKDGESHIAQVKNNDLYYNKEKKHTIAVPHPKIVQNLNKTKNKKNKFIDINSNIDFDRFKNSHNNVDDNVNNNVDNNANTNININGNNNAINKHPDDFLNTDIDIEQSVLEAIRNSKLLTNNNNNNNSNTSVSEGFENLFNHNNLRVTRNSLIIIIILLIILFIISKK